MPESIHFVSCLAFCSSSRKGLSNVSNNGIVVVLSIPSARDLNFGGVRTRGSPECSFASCMYAMLFGSS